MTLATILGLFGSSSGLSWTSAAGLALALTCAGGLYKCTADERDALRADTGRKAEQIAMLEAEVAAGVREAVRVRASYENALMRVREEHEEELYLSKLNAEASKDIDDARREDANLDAYLAGPEHDAVVRAINGLDAVYRARAAGGAGASGGAAGAGGGVGKPGAKPGEDVAGRRAGVVEAAYIDSLALEMLRAR